MSITVKSSITASYALFITTLFFAPLAFGSVETWSIAIVECLVFATALTYILEIRHRSVPLLKVPGILPLFLLLGYMWGQLIPLPSSVVQLIAPGIYEAYIPILNIQGGHHWIPLTVNQKSTILEALRITSYVFFYIFTVQLLSRKERLIKTVQIVAGLATAIAFFAILQKFTSPDLIYWFRQSPGGHPTGPWVYRNHYAGFMELLFPLVLALFFYYQPKLKTQPTFRSKIVSLLSSPSSNIHFFLGFSVILILVSIFVSLSRGGIVSANLALFFFLILLSRKSKHSKKILAFSLVGCLFLAVSSFGWEPFLARINSTTNAAGVITDSRLPLWQYCIPLIKDFFMVGSGFGTFIHAFPQYNALPTSIIFDHAHNDYIELLTDGGIIGFSLVAYFVCTTFYRGIKSLSKRKEPYSILLTIGALSSLFSILIHGFVDFNMHNGANGLYFFFLCGVLVSAGNTRIHFRNSPTLLRIVPEVWKYCILTALPLLLLTLATQGGILKAKQLYDRADQVYLNPQLPTTTLKEQLTLINKAITFDPLEGLYSSYQGKLFSYMQALDAALNSYLSAARKDPLEGAYLQSIGLLLAPDKDEQAGHLMKEGFKRGLNKEQLVFVLAEWYLKKGERNKAFTFLKESAGQLPDIANQLPQFLMFYKFTKNEMLAILPRKTSAWIALGAILEKSGKIEESEYFRSHALDFLEQEDTVKPSYFMQLYGFYKRTQKPDQAIATLHLGIKWLPDYALFHIYLGDYYKRQNILYRAKEEYEQALMLTPGNENILKRLRSIE